VISDEWPSTPKLETALLNSSTNPADAGQAVQECDATEDEQSWCRW